MNNKMSFLTVRSSGEGGRLGNHMFQYAFVRSISIRFGHKLNWKNPRLSETFSNIKDETSIIGKNEFFAWEKGFEFQNIDETCKNNSVCIEGYRQSWKYFEEVKENIKEDFTFKSEINDSTDNFLGPIRKLEKPIIAVQVRRGDYVINPAYITPSIEEIKNGMEYMRKKYNPVFLFISDGISWCKENFNNGEDTFFSENNSEGFDLCLITKCDHCLISCSTFGWWGAYLNFNQNKEVIVLSKDWFHPILQPKNTRDLLPVDWKVCEYNL